MSDIWETADTTATPGYLRLAQLGKAGTGKTRSSAAIALAVREMFALDGPICMVDTENGSDFIRQMVERATKQPFLVLKTRNIDKWIGALDSAAARGNMVFIGDSVSHVWSTLCDAYLRQLQDNSRKYRRKPPNKLQFQDWSPIKAQWSELTNRLTNLPLHMIFSGRAGFEYEWESDDRGGKELRKTDVKLKAEGEFEHEASLSLHYARNPQRLDERVPHVVTVRKDRADRLMGSTFTFVPGITPVSAICEFLRPHLEYLIGGRPSQVALDDEHQFALDEQDQDSRAQYKRDRTILVEKIQAAMVAKYATHNATDKAGRAAMMSAVFGTKSWTEIAERLSMDALRQGLAQLEQAE